MAVKLKYIYLIIIFFNLLLSLLLLFLDKKYLEFYIAIYTLFIILYPVILNNKYKPIFEIRKNTYFAITSAICFIMFNLYLLRIGAFDITTIIIIIVNSIIAIFVMECILGLLTTKEKGAGNG